MLVGGAERHLIDDLQTAAKIAGLVPSEIVPSLYRSGQRLQERPNPKIFFKEVVALVDVGFKSSTISILLNGELILSRVVAIGGDRLTSGLADSMSISYAEAEGIKIGMPDEVQSMMQSLFVAART